MKFTSKILPPYLRKSPKVENLLPILNPKGLSSSDFQSALKEFLGEDRKLCLLVIIGVSENGEKELLAVSAGYRESKDSWKDVLDDLRLRGLNAPLLAIGDGALGFWAALREAEGFEDTQEHRCWVHKIAYVLDKLPKRIHPRAKSMLHEIMLLETKPDALQAKEKFVTTFHEKLRDFTVRSHLISS